MEKEIIMPVVLNPQTGYLEDVNSAYWFQQSEEHEPRVISGEGTRVMLANAHPQARFETFADVEAIMAEVSTESPFDEPLSEVSDEALAAMEAAAPAVPFDEFAHMLSLDDLKKVAARVKLPGRSKMKKAELCQALIEMEADTTFDPIDPGASNQLTLSQWRDHFGIEVA